jgi:hypothetical protein
MTRTQLSWRIALVLAGVLGSLGIGASAQAALPEGALTQLPGTAGCWRR